jgi:hypothetical protein
MSEGSILTNLQNDLAGYMLQCENLDHLNIVVDDMGTIDSTAQKAVSTAKSRGGTQGIAAIILRPTVSNSGGDLPGPQLDALITIQMIENVLVNRSGRGSKILPDDMSFRILNVLHRLQIGTKTVYGEANPVRPLPAPSGFVSYEIKLKYPLYNKPIPKTNPSVIDDDGGTVTLTSTTPLAEFKYSLDGSYPSIVYTVPFAASSGDLVRSVATSPDLTPSFIAELTIE